MHGRQHDKGLSPQRLRRVGLFTGRLHEVAQQVVASGRITSTRPAQCADLAAWAEGRRPPSQYVPPALRAHIGRAACRLVTELAQLPTDVRSHGFIHGDLHPWNIVFTGDVAGAIDFGDCGWGHHALDLATTLQWIEHPLAGNHDHRYRGTRLRDDLLAGYAQVRALPPGVERQIDLYLAARTISTIEWIVDDWPRPDHRPWGPGFLANCGRVIEQVLG